MLVSKCVEICVHVCDTMYHMVYVSMYVIPSGHQKSQSDSELDFLVNLNTVSNYVLNTLIRYKFDTDPPIWKPAPQKKTFVFELDNHLWGKSNLVTVFWLLINKTKSVSLLLLVDFTFGSVIFPGSLDKTLNQFSSSFKIG